jgi:hypothetical protein
LCGVFIDFGFNNFVFEQPPSPAGYGRPREETEQRWKTVMSSFAILAERGLSQSAARVRAESLEKHLRASIQWNAAS